MLTKTHTTTVGVTHIHTQIEYRNSLGLVSIQEININNNENQEVSLYQKV